MRQAALHGKLPVPIFTPKNRRGQFALAIDVASWLAQERTGLIPEDLMDTGAIDKGGDADELV